MTVLRNSYSCIIMSKCYKSINKTVMEGRKGGTEEGTKEGLTKRGEVWLLRQKTFPSYLSRRDF